MYIFVRCSLLFSWSGIVGFNFFQLLNPCCGSINGGEVIVLFAKTIHGKQ